ncbi:MAG: hypothetical protein J6S14_15860 [Clostridia bacterium]|nr:hypothetical protein [Clostridia bacterium]
MKKEAFVAIMDGMRDYWDQIQVLETQLGVNFEDNFLVRVMDSVLDGLCLDMEGDIPDNWDHLIYEFAFWHNWGRDGALVVEIGEKEYEAGTAEELYYLLQVLDPIYKAARNG